MSEVIPLFLLHLLGFAGFLWLGLYALTHGDGGRRALLTGNTALITSCFFLFGGVVPTLHGNALYPWVNRATWWADVVPIALWLHLSLRLNRRGWRLRRRALWASYGAAAVLTVLGSGTDLLRVAGSSTIGPAYGAYVAYLFIATGVAVVNLARMERSAGHLDTSRRGRGALAVAGNATTHVRSSRDSAPTRLLVAGAVCFLLGAGYLALNTLVRSHLLEFPAYILLLAGLGAVGVTVAMRSALLLGRDVRRDVVYSFTGLAVLLALYLVVTAALLGFEDARRQVFAFVLVGLVTTGHTLYDVIRDRLDAAFFTPAVREERAAARAYTDALGTQPVGPHPDLATRKAFDDAVRRALTNLTDPTKLATTPLLTLTVVARGVVDAHLEDNRLNRAAVLRDILLDLLDGLRPHTSTTRVTDDAWRYYNCLYYPYVRGIGRRRAPTVLRQLTERRQRDGGPRSDLEQVLAWLLKIDEDTFYKWQRRGSDTVAAALRDRERAAGGIVPEPLPGEEQEFPLSLVR